MKIKISIAIPSSTQVEADNLPITFGVQYTKLWKTSLRLPKVNRFNASNSPYRLSPKFKNQLSSFGFENFGAYTVASLRCRFACVNFICTTYSEFALTVIVFLRSIRIVFTATLYNKNRIELPSSSVFISWSEYDSHCILPRRVYLRESILILTIQLALSVNCL